MHEVVVNLLNQCSECIINAFGAINQKDVNKQLNMTSTRTPNSVVELTLHHLFKGILVYWLMEYLQHLF